MSKHNYTQYSNKHRDNETETVMPVEEKVETVIPEVTPVEEKVETAIPSVELVNETVKTVSLPTTVEGVVVDCAKLNVRAEPNLSAEIVCVLNAQSEIEIDVNKSNNEWFYICTAIGIEGYCMRKYVEARL